MWNLQSTYTFKMKSYFIKNKQKPTNQSINQTNQYLWWYFQEFLGFSQHEKDAHRNLAPIDGRTSSQSLFWTLFVKKRISYEYIKIAGGKGKRERPLGEKGKGKGERSGFARIPTLQPERAHARTNRNRNRFPGWSHSPQPPIYIYLNFRPHFVRPQFYME